MADNARRVALVTGGTRGIGRAAVLSLAADGLDVAFCYRSADDAAREVEKLATEAGARVVAQQVDVTDLESVRRFVGEAAERLGPIDVAVTSAGITRDAALVMMKDEHWHEVIDVNLTGVYNVARTVAFDMMKRRSGCIITISSVAGVYGNPTQTNYSAAKAGIIGFTKALAKEVGRYGIRANAIAPGYIETDMTAGLSDAVKDKARKAVPLGRMGSAEDVAGLVSFLASDRASYVTGAVLHVDGGISL
ncbi:3-oxoacyl-[acyl-carrier-protein] reductase [Micromonospora sp. DT201]|uniref:3-oxoacyl-[acyl-carrier-protein] reductase n=1 Tax=Micromonospora sp. DT201 TaxID=3393442 RepID=UPI003CF22004